MANIHGAQPPVAPAPPPPALSPPPSTWWDHILDFFLTLWVLRVPLGGVVAGFALLGLAPQAQDLLVERATAGPVAILVFLALLTFVWAMPTHYAGRILIESDTRYQARIAVCDTCFIHCLSICAPRVLGALTYVAMLMGIYRSWLNLPTIGDRGYTTSLEWHLLALGVLVFVTGTLYYLYTIYREQIAAWPIFATAERLAAVLMAWPRAIVADVLLPPTRMRGGHPVDSNLGPLLLLLMFVVFTILPIIFPLTFAELFPRAASVAFIIGGWIPLLAYLSGVGRRARAPFITIAIALAILLPLFLRYDYSVRLIEAEKHAAVLVPGTSPDSVKPLMNGIDLKDAVTWWKSANCDASGKCPRPIIVAAAGGASRAGFFTASVIGQLLDDTLIVDGSGHGLKAADIAKRMFALSTVSGSSVGAVMTVAALAASRDGAQPCQIPAHSLWFGPYNNEKIGWRACLESLMSGDFLTPVAAGFVFRDVLRFFALALPWYDRAALLERSWESYFADLIGKPRSADGLLCVGSLDCPFMTLRPSEKRWVPLLVLNGTSVGTGQRIVTTALDWSYDVADGTSCPFSPRVHPCQTFTDGFIFHDLLRGNAPERGADDVRLSTAAHNSARFPFVSPPGTIVNSDREIPDRIVDGGYFENFGAQSAQELAQAIRAIDSSLNPFVLVLSNDPQAPQPNVNARLRKRRDRKPRTPRAHCRRRLPTPPRLRKPNPPNRQRARRLSSSPT